MRSKLALTLLLALLSACRQGPLRAVDTAEPCSELHDQLTRLTSAEGWSNALDLAESFDDVGCPTDRTFQILCLGAWSAANLQAWDRALAFCEKAARFGNSPWLAYETGTALAMLERHEEALAPLQHCLALQADHLRALQRYAESLAQLDRHHEALEYWTQALTRTESASNQDIESYRTSRQSLMRDSLLGRARSLDQVGHYEAAEADRMRCALLANP